MQHELDLEYVFASRLFFSLVVIILEYSDYSVRKASVAFANHSFRSMEQVLVVFGFPNLLRP